MSNKVMLKEVMLKEEDIKDLALGRGACYATDMVTVDGKPITFMYRADPKDSVDSGWVFLSGDETDDYMNNPKNLHIYDVNTIANYDPAIIEFLDAPFGTGFERDTEGKFAVMEE